MPRVLEGKSQVVACGRLLGLFERVEVPTKIAITGGALTVSSVPWEVFWRPVLALEVAELKRSVWALREAWSDYICSGFRGQLVREYCYQYFSLLGQLVELCRSTPVRPEARMALQATLGFECVGIVAGGLAEPVAAATSTLRNPGYLLAKLKHGSALNDPQFLPLVTVPSTPSSGCFYHYRQHKLSTGSALSLLLYLNPREAESFPAVNALERIISAGADPRADERAARIAHGIVIPYIKGGSSLGNATPGDARGIEIVDLGSGSGILVAKLCQMIKQACLRNGERLRVRAYLLDIAPSDPTRFFRGRDLRGAVDTLTCISSDYRNWLGNSDRLPTRKGTRLAIASRFFNNLSTFGITAIDCDDFGELAGLGDPQQWWADCIPSACLRSGGSGPSSLVVSNKRLWLPGGRSFVQASLSPYFEGLQMLLPVCIDGNQCSHDGNNVFIPLRSFRHDCLLTAQGRSVLAELLADCDVVVVNDADLRPSDLISHAGQHAVPASIAIDVTRPLRLKGHFTYAIGHTNDPAMRQLKGERLW
jgi:hypothetical protein